MTNSMGKLLPPGSGCGVVTMAAMPGILEAFNVMSFMISAVVRVRSLKGLVTMPEKPAPSPEGKVIWKMWSRSGSAASTLLRNNSV